MRRILVFSAAFALVSVYAGAQNAAPKFEKQRIGAATYEAASVFDVNKDGKLDIVSGEYWFAGPDFKTEHKICPINKVDDYYDDFSDYPMDVNGDGWLDIVTGGWWNEVIQWRENPKGQPSEWQTHVVDKVGNVERACFWDLDKDGQVEVVPNCPGKPYVIFRLVTENGKGTGKFEKIVLSASPQGHGLGCGDVDGDGRVDIIGAGGWFAAPADPFKGEWKWNAEFDLGTASVPVLVYDVNEDGKNDIIVAKGHDYGLAWYEQTTVDGKRAWTKHDIDNERSQYHDMALLDMDKDGKLDLVTGKRYRAHAFNDPGSKDPVGIYYFKINKGAFERVTLDYGSAETSSGAGIYFWVADIDGNGWLDVVAPGKEGLYLFKSGGPSKN
jgi:hypothetical protein